MANLIPHSQDDDIILLELTDWVKAGPGGKSNQQAQQLLNKITFLSDYITGQLAQYRQQSNNAIHGVQTEDNNLIGQVNILKGKSDVTDVVLTYADLLSYDTTTLYDNNIIKVLVDETHDYMNSYYRWHTQSSQFTFIGVENVVMPVMLTTSQTINPDDSYVYCAQNNITITLGASFTGCYITIVALSNTTVIYGNNSLQLTSGNCAHFYYLNGTWYKEEINVLDQAYPVGSVYMSLVDSAPTVGGTWTRLESGRILRSCELSTDLLTTTGNDTVTFTPTGSAASYSLKAADIPSHNHTFSSYTCGARSATHTHTTISKNITPPTSYGYRQGGSTAFYPMTLSQNLVNAAAAHTHTLTSFASSSNGSNTGHTHTITMESISISVKQSYINLYMWRRTA